MSWVADEVWHRVDLAQASSLSLLGWRSRSRAPGLVIRAGEVFLDASVDPASDPQSALKVALLAAQKDARPARSTLSRLVERLAPMPEPWPDDARRRFVDLLACGRDALPVIEALDQVRLWERMIPEWQPVRSRPQRNAYHRYTVDRHLLEATANAAALQYRTDRPDLLLVGTLLHDIGKGYPGDHTEVGIDLVRTIAARMGFDAADQDVLVDMVRYHLLLPDVATRRDLSDDATISHVAQEVGSTLLLDLLYSLTEADSLATGPAAWGTWKAGLVRELVHRTDQVLLGASADVMTESEFPTDEHRELLAAGRTVVRGRDTTLLAVAPDRPGPPQPGRRRAVPARSRRAVRRRVRGGRHGRRAVRGDVLLRADDRLGPCRARRRAGHRRTAGPRRPPRRPSGGLRRAGVVRTCRRRSCASTTTPPGPPRSSRSSHPTPSACCTG